MKRNILSPVAAIAAIAFSLAGCSSTDNQRGTTAMGTTTTETQAVAVTEPDMYDTGFQREYEAETRSGGLVLMNDVEHRHMFKDIENTKSYNLLSLAETSSNLSTFVELMRTTGMMSALEAEGSFTLFAPTNEAFGALPAGKLEHLMKPENSTELVDLLNAHMLPNKVRAGQLNNNHRITLDDDRIIEIGVDQNTVRVGGATIVKQNIEASNGIIHVVDAVITPAPNLGGPYGR